MLTIGIDPGSTGAVGILKSDGTFHCYFDLPAIRDLSLAWIDGQALTSRLLDAMDGQPARVIIERVGSRPWQGVASCFSFGMINGSILATLQSLRLPINFVTPSVWKKSLSLGSDKSASRHKAKLLFPICDFSLVKHADRAEALLIAHYFHTLTQRSSGVAA